MGNIGKQLAPHLIISRQFFRHFIERLGQDAHFIMPLNRYGLAVTSGPDFLNGTGQRRQGTHDFPNDEVTHDNADTDHSQADP